MSELIAVIEMRAISELITPGGMNAAALLLTWNLLITIALLIELDLLAASDPLTKLDKLNNGFDRIITLFFCKISNIWKTTSGFGEYCLYGWFLDFYFDLSSLFYFGRLATDMYLWSHSSSFWERHDLSRDVPLLFFTYFCNRWKI
jgi:hypothetical protein